MYMLLVPVTPPAMPGAHRSPDVAAAPRWHRVVERLAEAVGLCHMSTDPADPPPVGGRRPASNPGLDDLSDRPSDEVVGGQAEGTTGHAESSRRDRKDGSSSDAGEMDRGSGTASDAPEGADVRGEVRPSQGG